jgi:hypothetical protein
MVKKLCSFVFVSVAAAIPVLSQPDAAEPTPTPVRLVVTDSIPVNRATQPSAPRTTPTPIIVGRSNSTTGSNGSNVEGLPVVPNPPRYSTSTGVRTLSFRELKSKIADARRQMQSRPITTASTEEPFEGMELVRVAFQDWRSNKIDYLVMTKEAFLSTDGVKEMMSQDGRQLQVRTLRGNGVNTPIVLIDDQGTSHLPLIVQYPVVRGGKYIETAYYMSTHPGLVTPEVVNAGRIYVHNVIEIARERLRSNGISIDPKIADIAERLAAVEHVDHFRFRTEPHSVIFDDIYTLFALNEGQTYRYSVSSAGAGGMVQMIPSTYRMVRSWHPNVILIPDFVEGMRNHVNASQAMLLYMQRTWNDLVANPTVSNAVLTNIATQEQLMAAGYNSNPARLASYINRAGAEWTSLIPRETKIYLQIYDSVERNVPMTRRTR